MLLIVAIPDDPLGTEIAAAAEKLGRPVEIVSDFADIGWELRIDRSGSPTSALTHTKTGMAVESLVYLSADWSQDDGEFSANERMAAWWALLAAFPGPVVNRPTRHGLTFTLDRTRTRSATDCLPFRWVLRKGWQTNSHSLIRVAEGSHSLGTAHPGNEFPAEDVAIEITECTPSKVQRFAVGGTRVTPIEPYHQTSKGFVEAVCASLAADMPAVALVVAERTATDKCVLLDVAPWPSVAALGGAFASTIEGILEATR